MSAPARLLLRAAYEFGSQRGLADEIAGIRDMEIEWDRKVTSSLRRGYVVDLFERHGVLSDFVSERWPEGNTPGGRTSLARYRRLKAEYEDFLAGRDGEGAEEEGEVEDQLFALEAHLLDFVAKNLEVVEADLALHENGCEFPVDGGKGRIDILARGKDNRFVVMEFKLSHGRNKALGQLLYYMGWVDEHLGDGPCRGVIIASEIGDDLRTAVLRVPGVSLFRYHMKFALEPVKVEHQQTAAAASTLG
jgi:hypothetical protein